jgi:hypothetical protein
MKSLLFLVLLTLLVSFAAYPRDWPTLTFRRRNLET